MDLKIQKQVKSHQLSIAIQMFQCYAIGDCLHISLVNLFEFIRLHILKCLSLAVVIGLHHSAQRLKIPKILGYGEISVYLFTHSHEKLLGSQFCQLQTNAIKGGEYKVHFLFAQSSLDADNLTFGREELIWDSKNVQNSNNPGLCFVKIEASIH